MARSLDQCSFVSINLGMGNFVKVFGENYYSKLPKFYLLTKDLNALELAYTIVNQILCR